jgi:hypothetical protein
MPGIFLILLRYRTRCLPTSAIMSSPSSGVRPVHGRRVFLKVPQVLRFMFHGDAATVLKAQ